MRVLQGAFESLFVIGALLSHLRRSERLRDAPTCQLSTRTAELVSGQAARPISIGQLHALQRFHLRPINLLVWKGPLGANARDT
jgi:hypothetical protein